MAKHFASLALTMSITLTGLLAVTFVVGRLLPGDPVISVVGDRATD